MRPNAPLHVAYVAPTWPPGGDKPNGIVSTLANTVPAMRDRGHRVTILTARLDGEPQPDALRADRSAVTLAARAVARLSGPQMGPAGIAARQSLHIVGALRRARMRPDLIEVEESYGLAAAVKRRFAGPVVTRLHGPWHALLDARGRAPQPDDRTRIELEGRSFRDTDGVTAPTAQTMQDMATRFGAPTRPSEVVPNPIVIPPEAAIGDEAARAMLYVGRVDELKGADVLLRAAGRALTAHPGATLTVIGPDKGTASGGRTLAWPELLAAHVPEAARARVTYLGPQPPERVLAARRRHGIALVPSRYETFGNVIAEAMAAGTACIATRTHGAEALIEDGRTGLIVPIGDADGLAKAMSRLLADPPLLRRIGAAARASAQEALSPDAIAARSEAFYRAVLRSHEEGHAR